MARMRAVVKGLRKLLSSAPQSQGNLTFCRLSYHYGRARQISTSTFAESGIPPVNLRGQKVDRGSVQRDDRGSFQALFPRLVDEVVATFCTPGTEDVALRLKEVCEYNVPHGKLNRGLLVVEAFSAFNSSHSDGEDLREKAIILGWCVEWLQASLLVLDDVMDGSPLRRGRASWHANPQVGIAAVNDGLFLENCVFLLLERHFSDLPCYPSLVSLFRSILMKTIFGQSLDMASQGRLLQTSSSSPQNSSQESFLRAFSRARYEAICVNKTALYTFTLPVFAGLKLADVSDSELELRLSLILMRLGVLFQSQDDFLDFLDDAQLTGKVGTDIQEGKCSWFMVEALARSDENTRATLLRSYGSDDPGDVAIVKDIYHDLGLPTIFEDYEERMRSALKKEIVDLERFQIPTDFLIAVLDKMQKRRK